MHAHPFIHRFVSFHQFIQPLKCFCSFICLFIYSIHLWGSFSCGAPWSPDSGSVLFSSSEVSLPTLGQGSTTLPRGDAQVWAGQYFLHTQGLDGASGPGTDTEAPPRSLMWRMSSAWSRVTLVGPARPLDRCLVAGSTLRPERSRDLPHGSSHTLPLLPVETSCCLRVVLRLEPRALVSPELLSVVSFFAPISD